jgi:hypothetical protein
MTVSPKDNSPRALCGCLPAPVFRMANENNFINIESKVATPLDIGAYPDMEVGDIITLHVIGFDQITGGELIEAADFKQAHLVLEENIKKGFDFFIPGRMIYAVYRGRAEAYIEVTRAGVTARSATAHVAIDMRVPGETRP